MFVKSHHTKVNKRQGINELAYMLSLLVLIIP